MSTHPSASPTPLFLGCHLSAANGFRGLAADALAIGANVFQFFTRNPRGGSAKAIDPEDVASYLATAKKHHFGPILAHAPYTLNACSANPDTRRFAREVFLDDMARMDVVPGNLYNFHPGSHVGQGVDVGIAQISEILGEVLQHAATTVLLETMAGKGSEVGSRFEELRDIIDRVGAPANLGVCLDTCHVNDAGYDIVNDLDGVLDEFDRVIGLDRLRAIHMNDSKNPLGAHKDRHAPIDEGYIKLPTFVRILQHPKLQHIPVYLETPQDDIQGWGREIKLLRETSGRLA